jgi:hypothetical protein
MNIAPNPAMDDTLLDQHQEMLDHVGCDLIRLQNKAYYRGYEVARELLGSESEAFRIRCDSNIELWRDLAEALGDSRPNIVDIEGLIQRVSELRKGGDGH